MTELATIEPGEILILAASIPDGATFDEWLAIGRDIAARKRSIDWQMGDWIAFGHAQFPQQIELALGDVVGDTRTVRRIVRTVKAFPAHLRDPSLSFEHHAHVADLPVQEALPLLKRARTEHMSAKRVRIEAMLRKVENGQILPREEDWEDDAILAMVRAWNRAPTTAREEFAELLRDSHLGLIDFTPAPDDDP